MVFENIKNIDVNGDWGKKVFLTFDTEWAGDELLNYIVDIIFEADIKATFFCTHKTKVLDRMRENNKIELGIHPNFNFLLNGDFRYGKNFNEVIKFYKDIVPEAVSVRSHYLTQSTGLSKAFSENGIRYESNILIPGIQFRPWYDSITVKIPYFWEDYGHCLRKWEFDVNKFLDGNGLKVFNFHPLFVFLNIENMARYERSKEFYKDCEKLKKYRHNGYGMENMLKDLISEISTRHKAKRRYA